MAMTNDEISSAPAPAQEMPANVIQPEGQQNNVAGDTSLNEKAAAPASAHAQLPTINAELNTQQAPVNGQAMPTINTVPNPQTVTPLHLLGDHPQWIDCPFCQRRTQTRVSKEGTPMQMIAGVVCCLFCICLACVPCLAGWFENVEYRCSGCNNIVAMRPHDGPMQINGPQSSQNQVPSQYATVQQPQPIQPPEAAKQAPPPAYNG